MKNKHAQELGRMGNAKLEELKGGKEGFKSYMKELSKKAVEARNKKRTDLLQQKT